jgi:hypothetical protein
VEQQRAGLAAGALWTLRSYRLDYEGLEDRDGRPTERWSAQPRGDDPLLFPYRAWLDRELSLPLAVQMDDGQGQELYRMELRGLDLVPEIAEDAFALRFPRNAVVFEYDLGDPHQPLPDLARGMNFELLAPSHLPDGFELRRAVRGRHMLPTALLVLDDGQRWLSLSESRRMPGGLDQSQGLPVRVGEHDGVLVFAGSFSSLSWTQGDTALTLVGQLPYPELLAVAASMVSVTPGIRG